MAPTDATLDLVFLVSSEDYSSSNVKILLHNGVKLSKSSYIGSSDTSHFPCTPTADFMYSGEMKRDVLLSDQK